jgi:decaprenylphospho-beta-D-ribofuranose 2-oxidase
MLPAIPGTGFATIGGAVANDVHGKNHDRHGSIGDHVTWCDLLTANGEVVRISAQSHSELFAATIGGLGLTGVLVAVCLKLLPAPSNAVEVTEQRVKDLDQFFELFADHRESAGYSVGWIDALAGGRRLGRGILETAEVSNESVEAAPKKPRSVPVEMPGILLNRLSVRAFNEIYYRRAPQGGRVRKLPMERFFHPLDAISHWNRMYGRNGFHQFQCVIPEKDGHKGIRRLLEDIAKSGAASFLAVLKTLGGEGKGYLSFPMRGYTLALDFPARTRVAALLERLETIAVEHGGRVYLAKDSHVSADNFERMYPALPEFRKVLSEVDPDGAFESDIARRLRIRGRVA